MRTTITYILLIMAFVTSVTMHAAAPLRYNDTRIFNSNFKTLKVHPANNEFMPPVIELGSDERIVISFDEMASDRSYLRYKLIHCNADWQPSQLVESEYLAGFNEAQIDDYEFSSATFAQYVNYRLVLPNDDMQPLLSGNYLVQVYPENDPEDILLQARFYMSENAMHAHGTASPITDIDARRNHQQLSISVSSQSEALRNWMNDISLRVTQNSRPDTERILARPDLMERNSAVYQHNRNLIFPAGNEFRRFEVVATTYPGLNVASIEHIHPYYHVELNTDEPRATAPYIYDSTQHGHFKVRQSGAHDSDTEADYVVVHFALDSPHLQGGDIYIDGAFTNHLYAPHNRMRYNSASGKYETEMFLKMGSYNYQYLFVPTGKSTGSTAAIEGDHYPTSNEYMVRIYYHPPGARYDRLMGYTLIFSN